MPSSSSYIPTTVLSLFSVAVAGCFLGGRMDASDWNQNCQTHQQCTIVTEGNVCTLGSLAAINADEASAFRAERQRRRDKCISTTSATSARAPRVDARCSSDGQCWVKTGVTPSSPTTDAGATDPQ